MHTLIRLSLDLVGGGRAEMGRSGLCQEYTNLDELLMKGKRVCYMDIIHGPYQHFARIAFIFYLLQKGTSI
jgi:hypothetical protein